MPTRNKEQSEPLGLYKQAVENDTYKLTEKGLKSLTAQNPDWLMELQLGDEHCYILSKIAYDKHL